MTMRPGGRGNAPISAFRPTTGPGVAVGDWLRFLAEVARLVLELLARGRVLPALAWRQNRWLARWEPVTIDPCDALIVLRATCKTPTRGCMNSTIIPVRLVWGADSA